MLHALYTLLSHPHTLLFFNKLISMNLSTIPIYWFLSYTSEVLLASAITSTSFGCISTGYSFISKPISNTSIPVMINFSYMMLFYFVIKIKTTILFEVNIYTYIFLFLEKNYWRNSCLLIADVCMIYMFK